MVYDCMHTRYVTRKKNRATGRGIDEREIEREREREKNTEKTFRVKGSNKKYISCKGRGT